MINPSERAGGDILDSLAYEHGVTLLKAGHLPEAIAHFEQALGENSFSSPAREVVLSLADAYARSGRQPDAFRLYYEAAWSHPRFTSEFLAKTAALVNSLNAEKAAKILAYLDENGRGDALVTSNDNVGVQPIRLGLALLTRNSELVQKLLDAHADDALTKDQARQLAQLAYDAGDEAFADPKRYSDAIHFLRLTVKLDPDLLAAYWLLLEALRLRGSTPTPPNQADLDESADVWEQAKSHGLPTPDQSWCFLARAALNDQLSKSPNAQRWLLGWQSVCWCERSLLLANDSNRYVTLAQWYRFVALFASEREAYTAALEINPDDTGAREAELIWLANNGKFSEIRDKIAARRESDKGGWIDHVDAYVQLRTGGDASRALALVEQATKIFDGVWCQNLRISCLERLKRWDDVKKVLLELQQKYNPESDVDAIPLLAKAAWVNGDPERAVEIAGNYLRRLALPNDSEAYTSLGICYLAAGNLEQGRLHFVLGIQTATNGRELDDLLRLEIPSLEHFVADAHKSSVLAALDGADGLPSLLERRIEALKTLTIDSARELKDAQNRFSNQDPGGWLSAAVRAGQARLSLGRGDWQTAAQLYAALVADSAELLPEASRGVSRALQLGLETADTSLKNGAIAEAVTLYQQILDLFQSVDQKERDLEASAAAAMACAQLQLGNRTAAAQYLHRAAAVYLLLNTNWIQAAAHRMQEMIVSVAQLWKIHDLLSGLEIGEADGVSKQDMAGLQTALLTWIENYFQMQDDADTDRTPVVTPIMLEVGTSLVVDGSDTGPLVSKFIPAVRERIRVGLGFRIPAVRVRENTVLGTNGYRILLNNVPLPLENGSVPLDRAFARIPASEIAAHGLDAAADVTPVLDPLSNSEGCWVTHAASERLSQAGIEVWNDPLEFVLRRLEAVLLRRSDEFLGLDESEQITKEWRKNDDTRALAEEVLSKPGAGIHLARLIRSLLRDGVGIARYFPEPADTASKPAAPAILKALREINLNAYTLPAALMAVRLALRPLWQGKSAPLPVPWEQASSRLASSNAFIRPDEFQWLIASAREALQSTAGGVDQAIVVDRSDIAPFLRAALRHELPSVRVFSKLECEAAQA